jgi:hypothetical protein
MGARDGAFDVVAGDLPAAGRGLGGYGGEQDGGQGADGDRPSGVPGRGHGVVSSVWRVDGHQIVVSAAAPNETFGYETVRLLEERARFYAVLNAAASVVAGLGAAFIGSAVAQAIWT